MHEAATAGKARRGPRRAVWLVAAIVAAFAALAATPAIASAADQLDAHHNNTSVVFPVGPWGPGFIFGASYTAEHTGPLDRARIWAWADGPPATIRVSITTAACAGCQPNWGNVLGSATVTIGGNTGGQNWHEADFSPAIPVVAGQTYAIAYQTLDNPIIVGSEYYGYGDYFIYQPQCGCTSNQYYWGNLLFETYVGINDTAPPVVTVPSPIAAEATGPGGAAVTFSVSATDPDGDATTTPVCSSASGSTFPLGQTTVTCTASDSNGNVGSNSFTVTVQDTTPPTLSNVPSGIVAEATGPSGASVSYTAPTATDLVDGAVPVSCAPASGSTFALGTTPVTCSATDAHGNTASTSFNVTVQDTTPPTLSLPAGITTDATGPAGATVSYSATATDLVDGTDAVSCSVQSGSTFAIGTTTVSCSSTDAHGNTANGSFTVTVVGADGQLDALISSVGSVGGGSFASQLSGAKAKLDGGATTPACNALGAFINHVKAQSGKQLTSAQASTLIADAQRIQSVMGC